MFDYERVEADLLTLYRAAFGINGWSKDVVEELIYVGEYSLALDIMSYAYLNNSINMPDDLFEIFERLAVEMDMEEDPEFEGVAQLRAETKARLGSGVPNLAHTLVPGGPTIAEQLSTEDKRDAPPAGPVEPRGAGLFGKRRKHVLDGDGTGGGYGPGRTIPGRSNFPPNWSDEKTIEAILDVANDPASNRRPDRKGRTIVKGTRDGVDIEVVIDRAGGSIITAYPANMVENQER